MFQINQIFYWNSLFSTLNESNVRVNPISLWHESKFSPTIAKKKRLFFRIFHLLSTLSIFLQLLISYSANFSNEVLISGRILLLQTTAHFNFQKFNLMKLQIDDVPIFMYCEKYEEADFLALAVKSFNVCQCDFPLRKKHTYSNIYFVMRGKDSLWTCV